MKDLNPQAFRGVGAFRSLDPDIDGPDPLGPDPLYECSDRKLTPRRPPALESTLEKSLARIERVLSRPAGRDKVLSAFVVTLAREVQARRKNMRWEPTTRDRSEILVESVFDALVEMGKGKSGKSLTKG